MDFEFEGSKEELTVKKEREQLWDILKDIRI